MVSGQKNNSSERHPSHSFSIADWGWDPGLETEGKDYYATDPIRVNARPFFEQIRNGLVAAQDDGVVTHEPQVKDIRAFQETTSELSRNNDVRE